MRRLLTSNAVFLLLVSLSFAQQESVGIVECDGGRFKATCFVIASEGGRSAALTNRHVVRDSKSFTVTFQAGGPLEAQVVAVSDKVDMALLVFDLEVPVLKLANEVSRPEDPIRAIGYPNLSRTAYISYGVTEGYFGDNIQGTASIEEGVSGGPILNDADEVVGQVWAKDRPDGPGKVFGNNVNQIRTFLTGAGYT